MDNPPPLDRQERFAALYRQYQPRVLAYARRRFPEPDAAEVVADTFVAAWRHLERVPAEPLPWLYRLAANAGSNHRRRSRRWDDLQERARAGMRVDDSPDPAAAVVRSDQVITALGRLSLADQEILRLTAWEGLDGAELAVALDCSPTAAKVRLHRARRRLRRLLTAPTPVLPPITPTRVSPEVQA